MTQKLNEFETSTGQVTGVVAPSITTGDYGTDDAIEMSDMPAPPRRISIYAQSITPSTYSDDASDLALFDLVLTVGISEGTDGASKTYQVVKRIGINKEKIATEVCNSSPVSIVEAVQEPVKEQKQELTTAQIFRRLAGLG